MSLNHRELEPANLANQAALQAFPDETLDPHIDFQAVFTAVHAGTVDRGVIPVENSTNGFVVQILDLFAQEFNVSVVGETFVSVQQSLLGRRREHSAQHNEDSITVPNLSRIRTLYSHPQAWGQCTPFLTQHLRHTERVDTTSTSKAAELVAGDTSGESAAICSTLAAELYGLDVLVPSIEERKGNTTRFLILQNAASISPKPLPSEGEARYKTLIRFTVPHAQPSSLAITLAVFGKHGINLTSLNSRPNGDRKWNYIFFIEFWGQKGDAEVEAALGEVAAVVETWRCIGSWVSRGDGG
jgi:prephenate dehydratase